MIDKALVRFTRSRHACSFDTDALVNWQIQPLPSFIRKLPIPRLQEILAGDPAIAKYVQDLYMQADEKALEGRSSMLVRSRLSQRRLERLGPLTSHEGYIQSISGRRYGRASSHVPRRW